MFLCQKYGISHYVFNNKLIVVVIQKNKTFFFYCECIWSVFSYKLHWKIIFCKETNVIQISPLRMSIALSNRGILLTYKR